nr:hypothetical protein [Bradyrhizobium diazoefficiens]
MPIEVLRLARTQFDYLSSGFARNGDVISQAMSDIGGFAIDQATAKKLADSRCQRYILRHCERSEAIQNLSAQGLWIASLRSQ